MVYKISDIFVDWFSGSQNAPSLSVHATVIHKPHLPPKPFFYIVYKNIHSRTATPTPRFCFNDFYSLASFCLRREHGRSWASQPHLSWKGFLLICLMIKYETEVLGVFLSVRFLGVLLIFFFKLRFTGQLEFWVFEKWPGTVLCFVDFPPWFLGNQTGAGMSCGEEGVIEDSRALSGFSFIFVLGAWKNFKVMCFVDSPVGTKQGYRLGCLTKIRSCVYCWFSCLFSCESNRGNFGWVAAKRE